MRFKEVFQSHWLRMPGINPFTKIDLHSVRWQSLSMQQVGQGLCLSLCLEQKLSCEEVILLLYCVLVRPCYSFRFNFCPRAQLGPSFVFASFTLRLPQCIFLPFSSKQALDLWYVFPACWQMRKDRRAGTGVPESRWCKAWILRSHFWRVGTRRSPRVVQHWLAGQLSKFERFLSIFKVPFRVVTSCICSWGCGASSAEFFSAAKTAPNSRPWMWQLGGFHR